MAALARTGGGWRLSLSSTRPTPTDHMTRVLTAELTHLRPLQTLYTYPANYRAFKLLIAAEYATTRPAFEPPPGRASAAIAAAAAATATAAVVATSAMLSATGEGHRACPEATAAHTTPQLAAASHPPSLSSHNDNHAVHRDRDRRHPHPTLTATAACDRLDYDRPTQVQWPRH